jgi:hypothetical protein
MHLFEKPRILAEGVKNVMKSKFRQTNDAFVLGMKMMPFAVVKRFTKKAQFFHDQVRVADFSEKSCYFLKKV